MRPLNILAAALLSFAMVGESACAQDGENPIPGAGEETSTQSLPPMPWAAHVEPADRLRPVRGVSLEPLSPSSVPVPRFGKLHTAQNARGASQAYAGVVGKRIRWPSQVRTVQATSDNYPVVRTALHPVAQDGSSRDRATELLPPASPQARSLTDEPISSGAGWSLSNLTSPFTQQGGGGAAEAAASDPGHVEWLESESPGRVSLHAENAELRSVLRMIAQRHKLNLVVGPGVDGRITLSIENAELQDLISAIVEINGNTWHQRGDLLFVTKLAQEQKANAALAQGRVVRVFPLDYISAEDTQEMVAGMLSPVGQVFTSESSPVDQDRTRELLVVEDLPASVKRVEMFLAQLDQPPQQVLIEAHVLQVVLDDLHRHGINLEPAMRLGSGSLTLATLGLANEDAKTGMKITLDGTDIRSVVEIIKAQTNSRTLASPKVLVANRQESNIQIGKRLSYLTTTVTQTASMQSVQFLDTGVVLNVTPNISATGQILMQIQPKVSGGQLNPETELPEEESTELSTTVLLPDGGGVIIGGLIKDESFDSVIGVAGLMNLPYAGKFFRRTEKTSLRTEIIIALTARIENTPERMRLHEMNEMQLAIPDYAYSELKSPLIQSWSDEAMPSQFYDGPSEAAAVQIIE